MTISTIGPSNEIARTSIFLEQSRQILAYEVGGVRPGRVYVADGGGLSFALVPLESPDSESGSSFGGAVAVVRGWVADERGAIMVAADLSTGLAGTVYAFSPDEDFAFHGAPASRTGWALAAVRDVDGDSRGDLAMGAPLGGATGDGEVILWYGLLTTGSPPDAPRLVPESITPGGRFGAGLGH